MENFILNASDHFIIAGKRTLFALRLTVLFVVSGVSFASAQYNITGNVSVCPQAIESYAISGFPVPISYTWSLSGGSILSSAGSSITIVWGATGSGIVSVDLYNANGNLIGSPSLLVAINPVPAPVLTTDFTSDCVIYEERDGEVVPVIDPDECWHVCENSTVHYFVNPVNTGSTFTWTVSGSLGFTPISNNEIEVYWGTFGNGSVSVTETNQFGCTNAVTQCVKIIEAPRAIITGFPGGADCREGGTITVCIDQEALFFGSALLGNSNSPIISWLWNFDDPLSPVNISTHQNETHIWANPGTYYISLTVTNACNCSATCTLEVIVEPVNGVNIECPTPVCANDTGSYYTDAVGCVPYNWTVINGTIISPQPYGSSIQVQWNDGSNGNGILCLDNTASQCPQYCQSITCVEIPIISTTTTISGPSTVCIGSQTKYTVPAMTGSIYTWTITGAGGNIMLGQGTNEIFVDWPNPGISIINVTYTNEFLNCGGSGALTVEVKEEFSISGPEKGCPGGSVEFEVVNPANNTVQLNWTATDELNQVNILGPSTGVPSFIINWTYGSGTFVVTATDNTNTYCNASASFVIEISDPPPTPACPVGDLEVCPGTPHLYTAMPLSGNYYLNWNVIDGTPLNANGNSVAITWAISPTNYQILLTQIESSTGCESLPCTLDVEPIVPIVPILDSYPNPCLNSTATYAINTNQSNADQIIWSVANTTMGSVVSGQNTTTASIQWNNTPGSTTINVQIVTCGILGQVYTFPVTLLGNSQLTVTPAASTICDGASVDFSVNGNPSGSYSWDFGDGTGSTLTDPPPHPYNNTILGTAMIYAVTVTVTDNGCTSVGTASVNVLPAPGATIQASPAIICPPNTNSTLTAIQQGANLTYTWMPGNFSTQSIIVTAGTYTLTVQDANGCSSFNSFTVQNCPSGGGGCPSSGNLPDFTWSPNPVQCGNQSVTFTQTVFPPNQLSVSWDFGDGTTSTAANPPPHSYISAGNYSVVLISYDNSGQCDIMFHNVLVPLFAQFTATFYCDLSSTGNYQTEFINQSTYTNPVASISFAWFANGSGTAFSTSENPVITNYTGTNLNVGGNNTILLVISNGTATCSTTVNNFFIPTPPSPGFTISPITPGPYCQGQTNITFTGNSPGVHHALWNFGDGSSSTIFPITDRVYNADGFKTIILTVEDDYGCDYSFPQTIEIKRFGLVGDATAAPDHICPGDISELNINPGITSNFGSNIISQLWSNGSTLNPTFVNQTGTYNVIVTDDYGCSYEPVTPVNVTEYNVPSPVIRGDLALCEGENIMLDGFQGLGNPPYQYLWISILPNSATEDWLFEFTGATAGTYNVQLQIVAGTCTLSTSVDVIVNPLPLAPDIQSSITNPCEGQPIDLTVINAGTNWVNWSNGASGPMITVFNANIYEATVTDANGCTSSGQIEVHENPYFGFLFSGCVDFCDTVAVIIPGSDLPLIYDKWEWWVDGQQFNIGSNSVVPDLNLGMLPAGVYMVSLYLVTHYPDGTDCGMWSDPLEITVKTCPCHIDPNGRVYCMEVVKDDDNLLHNYHFEIWTNYNCPGTPNVTVTSPDGGVTLLPASNPPNYLTGIISTFSAYPQSVCFDLDFVDPLHPECNCNYRYCMRLPKCPFEPPCDFPLWITELVCIGYDGSGHPIYTFNLNAMQGNLLYSNFYAPNGWLSGMPFTIGPGLTVINGTFIDATPNDGFCIYLYAYDFTTHQMCVNKVCVNEPPSCNSRIINTYITKDPVKAVQITHFEPVMNLIPNPAMDIVNIQFAINIGGVIRIEDTRGKLIFEQSIELSKGTIEINTASWLPGIYFTSISNNSGDYIVKKLVIIK